MSNSVSTVLRILLTNRRADVYNSHRFCIPQKLPLFDLLRFFKSSSLPRFSSLKSVLPYVALASLAGLFSCALWSAGFLAGLEKSALSPIRAFEQLTVPNTWIG